MTERLGSAFAGMTMEPGAGQTVLVGEIRDQSHLYGILDRVRSLGLELVSVEPFRTDQAGDQDERTRARHAEHEVMGPSSPAAAWAAGRPRRSAGTMAYRALSLRARATACCLVDTPSLR
ncbi:MAG TPA: hypothetical protein VE733_31325 [Streptosporangiaceae bacterium]|nr:hypothetical protein [Streptosporangiaceae bacterium]